MPRTGPVIRRLRASQKLCGLRAESKFDRVGDQCGRARFMVAGLVIAYRCRLHPDGRRELALIHAPIQPDAPQAVTPCRLVYDWRDGCRLNAHNVSIGQYGTCSQ